MAADVLILMGQHFAVPRPLFSACSPIRPVVADDENYVELVVAAVASQHELNTEKQPKMAPPLIMEIVVPVVQQMKCSVLSTQKWTILRKMLQTRRFLRSLHFHLVQNRLPMDLSPSGVAFLLP